MPKYAISLTVIVETEHYKDATVAADTVVDFLEHHYLVEDSHHWDLEELEE